MPKIEKKNFPIFFLQGRTGGVTVLTLGEGDPDGNLRNWSMKLNNLMNRASVQNLSKIGPVEQAVGAGWQLFSLSFSIP